MKHYFALPLLALSLSACIKAPTLEERLADKTGTNREQEAYYACLERARAPIPGGHSGDYRGHESRMWAICDAIHEANLEEDKHVTR